MLHKIAAIAAAAGLTFGAICATATSAQTTANVGTEKSAKGAQQCPATAFFRFYQQRWHRGVPRRAIVPTSSIVGANSTAEVVLTGPVGTTAVPLSDLHFRVFFVSDPYGHITPCTRPIEGGGRLIASSLDDQLASKLQLTPIDNYRLQLAIPAKVNDTLLYKDERLIVIATQSGNNQPLATAEAVVTCSPLLMPRLAGIAAALLIYLTATAVVFFSRRRSARQSVEGTDVFRMETVKSWSWLRCLDPVTLTSDIFDRGSLSKLQILFFSLLVSYGLVYIVVRTGELSSISPTVVGLLGISALGLVGTQITVTTRDRLSTENWAWLVSRKVLPINDPGKGPPRWTDLIMSDAELDLYKLQALAFTAIVGVGMIVSGFNLATFSVPSELLQILGLSQLVFVGGKLARPATLGDLDDLLTELRKREEQLRRAAASGIDVDSDGKPQGAAQPEHPFTTLDAARAATGVPNAARRYFDVADQVRVLLDALVHRSVNPEGIYSPKLS